MYTTEYFIRKEYMDMLLRIRDDYIQHGYSPWYSGVIRASYFIRLEKFEEIGGAFRCHFNINANVPPDFDPMMQPTNTFYITVGSTFLTPAKDEASASVM